MVQNLWLRNTEKIMLFHACDLDFDPKTFLPKTDLFTEHNTHILKQYCSVKQVPLHCLSTTEIFQSESK